MSHDAFSSIAFSRDRRALPLADPTALLDYVADPVFTHVVAVRPAEQDPDHVAQAAEVGGVFVFEVRRDEEAVVELVVETPEEVVDAFRRWAIGEL